MSTPQLILTLTPSNNLQIELPSANGARRKVSVISSDYSLKAIESAIQILRQVNTIPANEIANNLNTILTQDNTISDILLRILNGQLKNETILGEDGAPTEAQVKHWERHGAPEDIQTFSDPSCPFCIAENRFEKGKNHKRSIKNLSRNEALRLGLLSRGYIPGKNNNNIYSKPKTNIIAHILNSKIFGKDQVQWSSTEVENLIQAGKDHALRIGFEPQEYKSRSLKDGAKVKRIVKKLSKTKMDKIRDAAFVIQI